MRDRFAEFIKNYDDKNLEFNHLKFREGAKITGSFGLEKGFSVVNGKIVFDTVRIHTGVDRGGGVIFTPIDFDFALFTDFGESSPYGSLLRLVSIDYGFEFRIAHIYPDEITPKFKSLLDSNSRIPRNTIIAQAGDYGMSQGRHTHTELVSLDFQSEVLETILENKFGREKDSPYGYRDIMEFYQSIPKFKNFSEKEVMTHYVDQMEYRRIFEGKVNKYKFTFFDNFYQRNVTRYSTELVFNGL